MSRDTYNIVWISTAHNAAAFPADLDGDMFMKLNMTWLNLEADSYDVFISESKFRDAGLGLFAKKGVS